MLPVRRAAAAALVLLVSASSAWAQTPEPAATPTRPTIERCQSFCATFFNEGTDEYAECARGCDDGEVCAKRCGEKFEQDDAKRMSCFKRCMANGRRFEPQPTPQLPVL